MNTRHILGEYTELLNKYGPESDEARRYFEEHKCDVEFAELAEMSKKLKKALTAVSARRAYA